MDISHYITNVPTACIPSEDEALTELLDFCTTHGITGLEQKHLFNPSAVLKVLRAKVNLVETPLGPKKGLLNG